MTISDIRNLSDRKDLLALNNASAVETSLLTPERFDRLVAATSISIYRPPAAAMLLAFDSSDNYDGGHFLWFRNRLERFIYIDRVVVAEQHRRHGLARALYDHTFNRAAALGHSMVVCEVNLDPPNPKSDSFHAEMDFREIGRATIDCGAKTVRYLGKTVGK